MSDIAAYGWSDMGIALTKITSSSTDLAPTQAGDEADQIPDWAAIAVLIGVVLAIVGFTASWATEKAWAPLLLTAGLIVAASGMSAAERAVCDPPSWRPIHNG